MAGSALTVQVETSIVDVTRNTISTLQSEGRSASNSNKLKSGSSGGGNLLALQSVRRARSALNNIGDCARNLNTSQLASSNTLSTWSDLESSLTDIAFISSPTIHAVREFIRAFDTSSASVLGRTHWASGTPALSLYS
jgi:hypothetical protein